MTKKFLIINGPNLNLLGQREPALYGHLSLAEITNYTMQKMVSYAVTVDWFQSNIEGEIVERIQKAREENLHTLIINPAAYSHTSVAILDALKLLSCTIIEVHLSNTHKREEFRHHRLTARQADIIMEGLGKDAYLMALLSQLND
jgi:3-dehydroquinate dehydratase II